MREMMRDYLKSNDISIKSGTDVNAVMRDMMSVLLEGALDEELDEELGYSKYDYRNKETENSRNGHSQKTLNPICASSMTSTFPTAQLVCITDKILPIVKEWQERPLEEVYAVVFMDAIHYHVRSEGRIVKRAVYIALGIDMNGKRDVLGMYVGENESAKFWLSIMNGLKNRGVEDILIACVDGLSGFPQAIEAVYPQTEIQQCIIHH